MIRNIFLSLILIALMALPLVFVFAAGEVAIYTGTTIWIGKSAADEQAQICIRMLNDASITNTWFDSEGDMDALANWMKNVTGDGGLDVCILYGAIPPSLYPAGNTQPDGSVAELFIETTDGDAFINHADYMFWGTGTGPANQVEGLQNMMDINDITMWEDNIPMKVTAEGRSISPSLTDFHSDRPFHVNELTGNWKVEVALAQNDDGTRADPIIVRDGNLGRLIPIMQTAGGDGPKGAVAAEVIIWLMSKTLNTTISVLPSPVQSPAIGEQLTLSLNITDGEDIAGYQATVNFDATALRFVSSENGDYLPTGAFAVPGVVKDNTVTIAATSLAGESAGDGTLATLTFEVIAAKASTLTLSGALITNADGHSFRPQVEAAQITEPTVLREDINQDGVVNIQDLVLVAANFTQTGDNPADVNNDGIVNIVDLTLVASALGEAAAAPSAHIEVLAHFTATEVAQWLQAAQQANLTDPAFQRGVEVLKHLLTLLVPKETVLLANYPNPFNPETWIPYQLARPADVTLRIHAVDGSLVRTLSLGHQAVGIYQNRSRAAYWDGKNQISEPVASGVYFYTLTTGDFNATRKMLIRK